MYLSANNSDLCLLLIQRAESQRPSKVFLLVPIRHINVLHKEVNGFDLLRVMEILTVL